MQATRSSNSLPQQGNEISPMLTRYPDTFWFQADELRELSRKSPTSPINDIKNAIVLSNKKSVPLIAEQHSNIRHHSSDFNEDIITKPFLKTKTMNGSDNLFVNSNETAEDYV